MTAAVAGRTEPSMAEAKRALDALSEIVFGARESREGPPRRARLTDGTCQAATKKRHGSSPATGEAITIAAMPAGVGVRARALADTEAALPLVQKARRRLAASRGRAKR